MHEGGLCVFQCVFLVILSAVEPGVMLIFQFGVVNLQEVLLCSVVRFHLCPSTAFHVNIYYFERISFND